VGEMMCACREFHGGGGHDISTRSFLTCYFSARSLERHPHTPCGTYMVLRKWFSSTDKLIYCPMPHVGREYSNVITRKCHYFFNKARTNNKVWRTP
jgi:hypothetical protein